jgi:hypothetical protein
MKARWLNTGDTKALLQDLKGQASGGIWSLKLEPRQPLAYERLD